VIQYRMEVHLRSHLQSRRRRNDHEPTFRKLRTDRFRKNATPRYQSDHPDRGTSPCRSPPVQRKVVICRSIPARGSAACQ
jgi:hypothetical protein